MEHSEINCVKRYPLILYSVSAATFVALCLAVLGWTLGSKTTQTTCNLSNCVIDKTSDTNTYSVTFTLSSMMYSYLVQDDFTKTVNNLEDAQLICNSDLYPCYICGSSQNKYLRLEPYDETVIIIASIIIALFVVFFASVGLLISYYPHKFVSLYVKLCGCTIDYESYPLLA